MKDTERKSRLFKQLWKLRDADEKFRALSIQNDLTKKEREEEKKLMNEAIHLDVIVAVLRPL